MKQRLVFGSDLPTGQARGLKAHGAVTAAIGSTLLRSIGINSPRQ
jgi:hypothetical protein